MEEWREIPGYEGHYEVSNLGRVKSLARRHRYNSSLGSGERAVAERILKQTTRADGYMTVNLWFEGVQKPYLIQHLVAQAFLGPRPAGMYVCHGNSVKSDNRLTNLRYDTPRENALDAVRIGTSPALRMRTKGEENGNAKLARIEVEEIRRRCANGDRMKDLAAEFGVSYSLIKQIRRNEVWL